MLCSVIETVTLVARLDSYVEEHAHSMIVLSIGKANGGGVAEDPRRFPSTLYQLIPRGTLPNPALHGRRRSTMFSQSLICDSDQVFFTRVAIIWQVHLALPNRTRVLLLERVCCPSREG